MLWYWLFHPVVSAVIGAFFTAYIHEQTGRDPKIGGLIGCAVGLVGGYWFLVSLWVYLYYNRLTVRVIRRRRPWWQWWRP